ncbi:MAG: DUF1631 family protein [Proteobacteria bacterium]|nr:DUF1631 family protein [Pseudomonadota bacterium]
MQFVNRVLQSAKDRALLKYSALVRTMLKDADDSMAQAMNESRSGADQRTIGAAIQLLRQDSVAFLNRIETLYREGVERGMRTMYTDLRQGLSNISADRLSLIDDETVNRQLEVDHLVQRLRNACDENLGRLNIMIAQIHGDADVHERENPFRPYLHARALYESLRDRTKDEDVAKILFVHLSNSLAANLSDYYAAICNVFDASGVQAKLLARPTKLKRHQRDQLAAQLAALNTPNPGFVNTGSSASPLPEDFNQRVLPVLQRMMQNLETGTSQSGSAPGEGAGMGGVAAGEAFQNFVWKIFNQPDGAEETQAVPALTPASDGVLARLDAFQHAASEQPEEETAPAEQNQLFKLSEKLDQATAEERLSIDVVAVLFDFILEDEQIPASLRLQIGRLQIPFLKAALLEPDLLQNSEHPARKLLNRMSSATVGLDVATPMGKQLDAEIGRLVKRTLQDFDKDVGIFNDCLEELERFLEEQLRNADAETALSVQAAEEAERQSVLQQNTVNALRDLVMSFNPDQRIADFVLKAWSRVLVRALAQGANAEQYRDILPELIWSGQQKQTPEDRSALMRMLPGLIKRLKIGMLMIHMPEDECQAALDSLVGVHTQILRGNPDATLTPNQPTLEEIRQEFSRLVVSGDNATWTLSEPPQVIEEVVEGVLAQRGATAEVDVQENEQFSAENDTEWLTELKLGTSVQMHAADTSAPARLIWISKHRSLYIFKMEQNSKPLIYSAASLVKALRDGAIRLAEYAPVFDRAVDSLMMGAEALRSARQ